MNPQGFLFGSNATVNVGGMATFTTADYIRLTGDGRFNANPNPVPGVPGDLLTAAPVAAFGFIGSESRTPSISKVANSRVAQGTGITLVGGDIHLVPDLSGAPSSITAPGRQIRLTSVAGPGEVAADTGGADTWHGLGDDHAWSRNLPLNCRRFLVWGWERWGSLNSRRSVGWQQEPRSSPVRTQTSSVFQAQDRRGNITVNVTGTAMIADSLIQTNSLDAGDAGAVSLAAKTDLTLTNSIIDSMSTNDSGTVGALGNGGAVTLTTEEGTLSMADSFIATVASNSGNAGAVTIMGKDVTFNRAAIFTDVDATGFDVTNDPALGQVHPGAVTVTAENTVTFSGSFSEDIGIPVISATAFGTLVDAGRVTITGKTANLSNGTVVATTGHQDIISPGDGGAIEIQGNSVNLTQFELFSQAAGPIESTGTGGSILLRGVDSLQANNIQLTASRVDAGAVTGGGGGPIELQTKGLTLSDGTIVTTSSLGPGAGGTITIGGARECHHRVRIAGLNGVWCLVVRRSHKERQVTYCSKPRIWYVLSGGQIGARTLINSTGNAGNITVQGNSPGQSILIDGTGSGIFTTTEGSGAGREYRLSMPTPSP